jgi:uncharacterized protein (DUF58 family)
VRPALGTALLGVACAVSAAAFGTPSLYVHGVGFVLLGAGAAAWVALAARGASVRRTLPAATVEEGEPLPVALALRSGLLPPPGGELVEPLLGAPVPVAGRRSRRLRVDVRFARRGRRAVAPSRYVIRDPLSLARREVRSAPDELIVLPRVAPVVAGTASASGLAAAAHSGEAAAPAELELDGLRPYRDGAPASRIHWATVARTGAMVERRLVADADARPVVVRDPRGAADEAALDAAVRAAASLCVHLARAGGCCLLLPGDRRATEVGPDLRSWPPLHVRLALVEPVQGPPVLSRGDRSGALFWVSPAGGDGPPALRRATAGVRFVVTPVPRGGARPSFTVAGCGGYRVGRGVARSAA